MKRHLLAILTTVSIVAIALLAMVSASIAQTMGEYGAATASASQAPTAPTAEPEPLDIHSPAQSWAGATQFPAQDQGWQNHSQLSSADRFGSEGASRWDAGDRFGNGDRFSSQSEFDSGANRFATHDRWSEENWGK